MQYDMKKSGENIRHLRIQKNYTQGQLAKVLGIDRSFLSCIESGKKGCSIDLLIQLSDFFSVSLDYLVFGTEWHSRVKAAGNEGMKGQIAELIDHLEAFKTSL